MTEESTRSCPACTQTIPANARVCPYCRQRAEPRKRKIRSKRLQEATKRDLKFEAHVVGVSMGYRVTAVTIALFFGLFMFASAGLMAAAGFGSGAGWMLATLLILVGICGFWYAVGHFLSKFSNGARVLAGILMILLAVGQGASLMEPDGAFDFIFTGLLFAWTGAVVWLLFSRRAANLCTDAYRERVAKTNYIKPAAYKSPFFWGPFFVTGVFFLYIWVRVVAGNV